MSRTASARPAPARVPRREPARAPLRLVPTPRTRVPRAPFVGLALTIVGLGLLGLLLLNTGLAQHAFTLHAIDQRATLLREREQSLRNEVARLEAPGALAARAAALGLVPGQAPAFLDVTTGQVLGAPAAAPAPIVATVPAVSPSSRPAPSPSPSAAR